MHPRPISHRDYQLNCYSLSSWRTSDYAEFSKLTSSLSACNYGQILPRKDRPQHNSHLSIMGDPLSTRYMLFANWEALMDFMMRGLEIGPDAKPP